MISNIKKCKIVSFVGLAKNVGKTTALNHFLKYFPRAAVTSIGIDGEFSECSVDGTKKPRISLKEGNLFTTAEESIQKNRLSVRIIEKTNILTPLGHIVIAEAKMPGSYEIYPAGSLQDTQKIAEKFLEIGAEKVFIDGAFFRVSHASISSGCVLVSGSNASMEAEKVISETKRVAEYFSFKGVKLEKREHPYIVENGKIKEISVESAISNEKKIAESVTKGTTHVYLPGAFTPETFDSLKKLGLDFSKVAIVIDDGTKCFLGNTEYNQLLSMGGQINVLNKINLCGIAVNSFSAFLGDFDPKAFLERMKAELKPIEVEDLLLCS